MKISRLLISLCIITTLAAMSWAMINGKSILPNDYTEIDRAPKISPDYTNTVIPPNIAPLNLFSRMCSTACPSVPQTARGAKTAPLPQFPRSCRSCGVTTPWYNRNSAPAVAVALSIVTSGPPAQLPCVRRRSHKETRPGSIPRRRS